MKTKLLVVGLLVVCIALVIKEMQEDLLVDLVSARVDDPVEEWGM